MLCCSSAYCGSGSRRLADVREGWGLVPTSLSPHSLTLTSWLQRLLTTASPGGHAALAEDQQQRTRDVDRAVGTDDHADDHHEAKQVNPFAAPDVQHDY